MGFNAVTQRCREGVNQTAFDPVFSNDEFPLASMFSAGGVGEKSRNGLHWLSSKAFAQMCAPADIEATVGGAQRCDWNPGPFKQPRTWVQSLPAGGSGPVMVGA